MDTIWEIATHSINLCVFMILVISNIGFEDRVLVLSVTVPGHSLLFTVGVSLFSKIIAINNTDTNWLYHLITHFYLMMPNIQPVDSCVPIYDFIKCRINENGTNI